MRHNRDCARLMPPWARRFAATLRSDGTSASEASATRRSAPASTYAEMVQGLLQHDAYHGGQIGLLRKALGAPPAA